MLNDSISHRDYLAIPFGETEMLLTGEGSIYWEARRTLIVSDLHLEKGSFMRECGFMIPALDTLDCIHRIERLVEKYQPTRIISLGDNIHDGKAFQRIHPSLREKLRVLSEKIEWQWILGNHDGSKISQIPATLQTSVMLNDAGITFTHEPINEPILQLFGHYHPKLTVRFGDKTLSGKCFVVGDDFIVLPAFGKYTGGLDVHSRDFMNAVPNAHYYGFIYQNKVWRLR